MLKNSKSVRGKNSSKFKKIQNFFSHYVRHEKVSCAKKNWLKIQINSRVIVKIRFFEHSRFHGHESRDPLMWGIKRLEISI